MTGRVDSHHHVWDLARRDQPWINGAAMAPIARTFHIDELVGEAEANGIAGSVVVQTVASTEETDELLDLAGRTPFVLGVVGYVDLCAPDVGERIDRLLAHPSGQHLVGLRSPAQDEPDPDWLAQPAVIAGLRAVADRGLTFDLLIRPHQLDAATRAVRAVPDGRFVLDHLAKPPIASRTMEPWAGLLAELASAPNVVGQGVRAGHRSRLVLLERAGPAAVRRPRPRVLRAGPADVRQRLARVHARRVVRPGRRRDIGRSSTG